MASQVFKCYSEGFVQSQNDHSFSIKGLIAGSFMVFLVYADVIIAANDDSIVTSLMLALSKNFKPKDIL